MGRYPYAHACCDDFPPILQEFVRQFREFTNIRFEAREKRFISALFPQAFESRHT